MSGVETVIPFYGDDPGRLANLGAVKQHLMTGIDVSERFSHITVAGDPITRVKSYPLWVETGRSPGDARNKGAENCCGVGILFNDADSICPWPQILEAVKMAVLAPGLVFAYDLYCRWNAQATERWCASDDPWNELGKPLPSMAFDGDPIFNSGSMACVAISRTCFEQVGGFDESYVGWGYEDLNFAQRCNALWPNRRVSGPVYHLWHGDRRDDDSPEDSDPEQVVANFIRWKSSQGQLIT